MEFGRLADAAIASSTTARDALDISQRSFKTEMRPFVVADAFSLEKDRDGTDGIQMIFINIGRTPAIDFREDISENRITVEGISLPPSPDSTMSASIVGAGRPQKFLPLYRLKEPYKTRFGNGEVNMIVRGTMRYRDIFSCEHWTKYCLETNVNWNEFRWCTPEQGENSIDSALACKSPK